MYVCVPEASLDDLSAFVISGPWRTLPDCYRKWVEKDSQSFREPVSTYNLTVITLELSN